MSFASATELKRWWAALLERQRVARLRRRFAKQIGFVQARLSPEGAFGLHLTIGALFLIGAV